MKHGLFRALYHKKKHKMEANTRSLMDFLSTYYGSATNALSSY